MSASVLAQALRREALDPYLGVEAEAESQPHTSDIGLSFQPFHQGLLSWLNNPDI
jgi:hypothetical protein